MRNPPTVSYGPSSGTVTLARSSSSSGRSSPGKVSHPRLRTTSMRARSCSSDTSPTISSTRSSSVTTPAVPPYSSTTMTIW